METWKHFRAILLLPVTGSVVIPGVILWLTGPDTLGLWQSWPATRVGLPILGGVLACLGLVLMVATIRLFMTVGKGTLAPWNPPQRLVVRGVYRHVRNPMISGRAFRCSWGGGCGGVPAPVGLVHLGRDRQCRVHPAVRGAGAGKAVRRRLPDLQAERAEMDSEADAVADRSARS